MPKFGYVPVANAGTSGALYMRSRSSNLAFDDVSRVTEFADDIIKFLRDRISEQDLEQVKDMLKMEAGVKTDQQEETDKMIAGAKERGRTAQDAKRLALDASAAASTSRQADFAARFPGTQRLGHV